MKKLKKHMGLGCDISTQEAEIHAMKQYPKYKNADQHYRAAREINGGLLKESSP